MEDKRLDGWKAIAGHFGVSARTVIRWAEDAELPVHRVPLGGRFLVFAIPSELDAWLASGEGQAAAGVPTDGANGAGRALVPQSKNRQRGRRAWRRAVVILGCLVVACAIATVLWVLAAGQLRLAPARAMSPSPSPAQPFNESGRVGPPVFTKPKSADRVALRLEFAPRDEFIVDIPDGGLATIERPGGDKLGLTPVLRNGQLEVLVFRLFRRQAGAPESAHQLAVVPLRMGAPSRVEAGAAFLTLTWSEGQTPSEDDPAQSGEPCCIFCGEATVCAVGVVSVCGMCGSLSARAKPTAPNR